jgi:hypothetical protein
MPLRTLALLTALLFAVLAPGFARASETDHASVQTVDGYTVALTLTPDQVETGPNAVVISIRAADGAPVSDAAVTVAVVAYSADDEHGASHSDTTVPQQEATLAESHGDDHAAAPTHDAEPGANPGNDHAADGHGHAAIPTMLERGAEAGTYVGTLHFEQAGEATVTVAFTIAGHERAALFVVPVVQARPRALVLGGFALVNGLAILAAAVLKRRMPQRGRAKSAAAKPPVIPLTTVPAGTDEERPA